MAKKRGLGRGLNALLGSASTTSMQESEVASPQPAEVAQTGNQTDQLATPTPTPSQITTPINSLAVDQIQRGKYQPRIEFDAEQLQELTDSILEKGMIQPVLVRKVEDGYELIAGERRWRAAQLAELHNIPVIVKEYNDEDAAAIALIENIQREDLKPLEEAMALHRLQEEFAMTHKSLAQSIGKSRTAVSNLLRLLDLNDDVKQMLQAGKLEMGHARALLSLEGSDQVSVANTVYEKALSVRETEKLVKARKEVLPIKKIAITKVPIDPDIQALQHRLSDTLGAKVDIKHKSSGKGKLEVAYSSLDELEGILAHIN